MWGRVRDMMGFLIGLFWDSVWETGQCLGTGFEFLFEFGFDI